MNADIIDTAATCVIALVGAFWTYRQYTESRQKETALTLDLNYTTSAYAGDDHLAMINITVKNVGRVKVTASDKRPAYNEPPRPEYLFQHGFDLKVRKLPTGLTHGERIDWFTEPRKGWPSSVNEFDVATGYVKKSGEETLTDFWMEPSETYTLTVPVVLERGSYLALVTFIGEKDGEYWQRLFPVNVPVERRPPIDSEKAAGRGVEDQRGGGS